MRGFIPPLLKFVFMQWRLIKKWSCLCAEIYQATKM